MRTAHVNGIDVEYDVVGAGEPVLMISPMLADGFRPLLAEPALAERYALITYHRRGWAGSTHTPAPVAVADHGADAAALLDSLGVRRAHVVGHSSGAPVALQLALDSPERVHTLALLELSLVPVPAAAEFMGRASPALEAYAAGQHETAVAHFLSLVSGLDWPRCRAVLDAGIPGAVHQAVTDADTFFGIELPAVAAWSFGAEQAAMIAQPVLSVRGGDTEALWVQIAERLRSWFPQVEEYTIPDIGHLLHIQRSTPVAQCLAAFLHGHPLALGEGDAADRYGVMQA
jgi:pimeloyl-ACP methyl ester carboxylesterase